MQLWCGRRESLGTRLVTSSALGNIMNLYLQHAICICSVGCSYISYPSPPESVASTVTCLCGLDMAGEMAGHLPLPGNYSPL